jgi:serine/threonine protein phosphatase PrpC
MKQPKDLVCAIPDVRIFTVDFNQDHFILLGSDGIWDVITDQAACEMVNHVVKSSNSPQKVKRLSASNHPQAAETLTKAAKQRGSSDDKTATVILFSWHGSLVEVGNT